MSKYMIHTCYQRLWYVKEHLIPSMVTQGIDKNNIDIYLDENKDGCLLACMKCFYSLPDDELGTWHLQDDILISSDFKEKTEQYSKDYIVCGYCYTLDANKHYTGIVKPNRMWYSFPCVYIPNEVAKHCAGWFFNKVILDRAYSVYVNTKKYDDLLFHIFVEDYFPDMKVLNLTPNIVDHIDYLIGGSVVNFMRTESETPAVYFTEHHLITELEETLKNR